MQRIFIGYDGNETVALHVLMHSIMRHARKPVAVTPLVINQLPMYRERDPLQSTDFAFSRFLVPWLCHFEGQALFIDCDMLCREDISLVFACIDPNKAVSVVQHDYTPKADDKFLSQEQSRYNRKNWSSVMLFNNDKCQALTPNYVNSASGLELHQFKWLQDEQIGKLDPRWNHLVGEYAPNPDAKIVHFTLGTPCFPKYQFCEYADDWRKERSLMLHYNPINAFSLAERMSA